MDIVPRPGDDTPDPRPEPEAERQRRVVWEAERIAEADADIATGRLIDEAAIDAWIDSIGTDHELPPPRSARQGAAVYRDGFATPREPAMTSTPCDDG